MSSTPRALLAPLLTPAVSSRRYRSSLPLLRSAISAATASVVAQFLRDDGAVRPEQTVEECLPTFGLPTMASAGGSSSSSGSDSGAGRRDDVEEVPDTEAMHSGDRMRLALTEGEAVTRSVSSAGLSSLLTASDARLCVA